MGRNKDAKIFTTRGFGFIRYVYMLSENFHVILYVHGLTQVLS